MARHATYEQRIQIHTLRGIGWSFSKIADHLHLTYEQVKYLSSQPTEPAPRSGRPEVLGARDRRRIINFVTASATNRRMPLWQVSTELDLGVSEDTMRKAVRKEGMGRRVARVQPYLSEVTCQTRLQYAQQHKSWTIWD